MSKQRISNSIITGSGVIIGTENKQDVSEKVFMSNEHEDLLAFLARFSAKVSREMTDNENRQRQILEQLAFLREELSKNKNERSPLSAIRAVIDSVTKGVSKMENLERLWSGFLQKVPGILSL